MKNIYYNQIIDILLHNNEGLKVKAIVQRIYNENCSLFDDKDFHTRLYTSIRQYLWRQSRIKKSPFCRNKWGTYSIKKQFALQLELCFDDWSYDSIEEPESKAAEKYIQLSLF